MVQNGTVHPSPTMGHSQGNIGPRSSKPTEQRAKAQLAQTYRISAPARFHQSLHRTTFALFPRAQGVFSPWLTPGKSPVGLSCPVPAPLSQGQPPTPLESTQSLTCLERRQLPRCSGLALLLLFFYSEVCGLVLCFFFLRKSWH